MQSQLTKQLNAERADAEIGSQLNTAPGSVTTEDASHVHSRESRALGGQQPPKGSVASRAQSIAAANEKGATGQPNAPLSPAEQSQLDREANYSEAVDKVGSKMAREPERVTKEDGDLLHSRETKAFGATEKGGLASQAQSLAAENAGDKNI